MPLKYMIYEDYMTNIHRLNISNAIKNTRIEYLAIHGSKDETIPVLVIQQIHKLNAKIKTHIIEEANHTFGMVQPWVSADLPTYCNELIFKSINFLQS